MLFFDGGFALLFVALWLFCLFDVITTDPSLCRNLPKGFWVLLVLLLPDVGSIIWLVAGRTWNTAQRPGGLPYKGNSGVISPTSRPNRRATNPDDDEAFLRQLRDRAQSQRQPPPPVARPADDDPAPA